MEIFKQKEHAQSNLHSFYSMQASLDILNKKIVKTKETFSKSNQRLNDLKNFDSELRSVVLNQQKLAQLIIIMERFLKKNLNIPLRHLLDFQRHLSEAWAILKRLKYEYLRIKSTHTVIELNQLSRRWGSTYADLQSRAERLLLNNPLIYMDDYDQEVLNGLLQDSRDEFQAFQVSIHQFSQLIHACLDWYLFKLFAQFCFEDLSQKKQGLTELFEELKARVCFWEKSFFSKHHYQDLVLKEKNDFSLQVSLNQNWHQELRKREKWLDPSFGAAWTQVFSDGDVKTDQDFVAVLPII